jgi:hypothetical protein
MVVAKRRREGMEDILKFSAALCTKTYFYQESLSRNAICFGLTIIFY